MKYSIILKQNKTKNNFWRKFPFSLSPAWGHDLDSFSQEKWKKRNNFDTPGSYDFRLLVSWGINRDGEGTCRRRTSLQSHGFSCSSLNSVQCFLSLELCLEISSSIFFMAGFFSSFTPQFNVTSGSLSWPLSKISPLPCSTSQHPSCFLYCTIIILNNFFACFLIRYLFIWSSPWPCHNVSSVRLETMFVLFTLVLSEGFCTENVININWIMYE